MAAAVKTVLRVNVWSVLETDAVSDTLGVAQRVGCFSTMAEAIEAAAKDGEFGPTENWNFNPVTSQIWRKNAAGSRLYAIKRIQAAAMDKVAKKEGAALEAELAEAAKAAKATPAQKARAAATVARASDVALRKNGEAHQAELAAKARTAEEIASLHAYEAEVEASAALRLAAAEASSRLDKLEVAVEVAAAKADAALPL